MDALNNESKEITRQTQALMWLYSQLDFRAPLPPMRGWAISPDFAALLVERLRQCQPQTVLEFGGGTSTLITAQTLKQMGRGHVIAVEALAPFAVQARADVQRLGLEDVATVIHAPLTRVNVNRQMWQWYDPQPFAHVTDIDFLMVDGPAQHNNPQRMTRYPALPLIASRLTDNALIVMDDTNRDDEQSIVRRWLTEFDSIQTVVEHSEFEKGAVVLQHSPNV